VQAPTAPAPSPEPPAPKPARLAPVRKTPPKKVTAPLARREPNRAPLPAAKTGTLRVVTLHSGKSTWASLFLDGVASGGSPTDLEVPAGVHRLKVTRAGFSDIEREVTVRPGALEIVRLELQP
jgi:hypothetical protein